jgi:hypothetical protein
MQRFKVAKISVEIHESLLGELLWALEQLGIRDVFVQNARTVQLAGTTALRTLVGRPEGLRETASVAVHAYVPPTHRDAAMQFLIRACGLDMPGQGSLMASDAELVAPDPLADAILGMKPPRAMLNPIPLLHSLMAISCIVFRGQGNLVARAALSLGTSVPFVTFGEGTGLRDKLGLLRVTIPAAKEVVNIVVSDQDAQGIMQLIIGEARLNQAGKGFISCFRIETALLNAKLRIGHQSHAASMEQIITAIDHLAGNSWWRRRFDQGGESGHLPVMRDRLGINCVEDEGSASRYSVAAMSAGAGGATSSVLRYQHAPDQPRLGGDNAKSKTNFVVGEAHYEPVIQALLAEGIAGPAGSGFLELQPRPLAFTYQQQKK